MDQDDHVCLCFRVSLRKIRAFLNRGDARVPSQLSDCLGAGTGCRWCVPFLTQLHAQWERGEQPDLAVSPDTYSRQRIIHQLRRQRETEGEPSSDSQ